MADKKAKKGITEVTEETPKVEEPKAPPADEGAVETPPAVPQLPPGVEQKDLSEKEMEKLGQLDALEKRFNEGCGTLIKGLGQLLYQSGQIEQQK